MHVHTFTDLGGIQRVTVNIRDCDHCNPPSLGTYDANDDSPYADR
jgi:hypothetical protein